ncbi:MAG: hypothetical protein P1U35_10475 [Cycloclasticus sp.]|nr:hypothetical protein [Cycloclasticus sp.]
MDELVELLKKLVANQEIQLQQQKEVLLNQEKALEMQKVQFERAENINKKSEETQDKAMNIQKFAAKLLYVLVPILFVGIFMLVFK